MNNSISRLKIENPSRSEGPTKSKNGVFIYAESGAVFQGLVQSLERTFPNLEIYLADELVEAEPFDSEVGLALIQASFADDVTGCVMRCRERFPSASITMMIEESATGIHELSHLFDNKQIQGLLPFNLKLDVWLAVIWLLLNGGEYYPTSIVRSAGAEQEKPSVTSIETSLRAAGNGTKPIKTLTIREHQILELLSEGLQNKIIADRLSLSEHTVKVHVHNLIRKLRVHNRTQAAAVYRNNKDQERYSPPFRGYGTSMARMNGGAEMVRAL